MQILVSQGTSSLLHSGIRSATTNLKCRSHEQTVSPNPNPHLLHAITVSPPWKRINAPQTVFSSLDTEQLREGLKVGGSVSQSVDLGQSNNPNTTPTKDYEIVRVVVYLRSVQRGCAEEGERGSTPTG